MTRDDLNKSLLLILAWREARGDGLLAMRAVMHVVKNRVTAQWGSWDSMIEKHNQFSSISVLGDTQTIVWPKDSDGDGLFDLVEAVYNGTDSDNTNGALFYAREDEDLIKTSPWYVHNIISNPKHPIVAKIGTQTFRA